MKDELSKQQEVIEQDRLKLDKLFSKIAVVRLIVFLVAIILLFMSFSEKNTILLIVSIVLFIIFIFLVKYHGDIDEKILASKAKSNVINRYLMRVSGEWRGFQDDGSDFLTKEDTLSYDLDLLGKNSLFQMICIAHTFEGRKKLADTLSLKKDFSKEIDERYEAITEIGSKMDFMIDFEATSERIVERRKKELEKRAEFSMSDEEEKKPAKELKPGDFPAFFYPLMILVPAINIATVVMVLAGGQNPARILASFIIGIMLTWFPKTLQDIIIEPVYKYGTAANDYYKMLRQIGDRQFESQILKKIHSRVTSQDGLLRAIKSLGTIGTINNISFNPLVHMILAGFLGWDYYIAFAAAKWSKNNSGVFDECIDIIADIEELESLAVLSLVRKTQKPDIYIHEKDNDDLKISVKDIYHPLLNPDTVISNSSEIDGKLTVITGSNMSGKTTFMRTIAVNMVLSFTGSGVCASSFRVPYMKIFTSMRVMDDVSGGISTFYAEILRIKEMAEYVSQNPDIPAICLIDEIFKGTNSADRIVGSEEALKKLAAGNSMVIVTTHDFELCDLKTIDGKNVDNYHFEEQYVNNTLQFDYKIRDGRCTTRNAIAILKMAGLVQD
ncbi:MAG: DNA mismatch repair protein MutS [Eubacterium sp.]|nr:DNA mismatch repair protein MutS [Eubacterium sp.]